MILKLSTVAAVLFASIALVACEPGEREASSETPVASAEVKTSLPEAAVSDQELQQSADQAAAAASTPAPGTTSSSPSTTTGASSTTTTPAP